MRRRIIWGALIGSLAGTAGGASGQLDYRNLDDDRPVRAEDATPVETYAFELLLPYSVERERGGTYVHAVVPELSYGAAPNFHVGLKAPMGVESGPGTAPGLSGLQVFGFYSLNPEIGPWPATALRIDAELPVGGHASSNARIGIKGIATRSIGPNRVHVNAAYRVGSDGSPGLVEPLPRWWAGVAVDRTLYRSSVLLIAEARIERGARGEPLDVTAGAGLRWQWTPTDVLDVGVSRELRGYGHGFAVTFGLSHVFAVPALVPGAR